MRIAASTAIPSTYRDIPALIEEIVKENAETVIEKYPTVHSLDDCLSDVFCFLLAHKKAIYHIYNFSKTGNRSPVACFLCNCIPTVAFLAIPVGLPVFFFRFSCYTAVCKTKKRKEREKTMRFSKAVVKYRLPILILAVALLIPSVFGMVNTRINYDMLTYLPSDMDTVKGQDVLLEDFGKGAFSLVVAENMPDDEVAKTVDALKKVEHVESVVRYTSFFADISIPKELLPEEIYDEFNTDDCTLFAVFFDSSTSADVTMDAIREVRRVAGERCFVSGIGELKDGAERLAKGCADFDEAVTEKLRALQDELLPLFTRMRASIDASRSYTNFSGIAEGTGGSVRFVYRTGSLKKKD